MPDGLVFLYPFQIRVRLRTLVLGRQPQQLHRADPPEDLLVELAGGEHRDRAAVPPDFLQLGPELLVVEIAQRRLGISPERCIVVEDAALGVEGARRGDALHRRQPQRNTPRRPVRAIARGPAGRRLRKAGP